MDTTACAESRMRFANATKINRKSGVAKRRDLRFRGPFLEMFFFDKMERSGAWVFTPHKPLLPSALPGAKHPAQEDQLSRVVAVVIGGQQNLA